MIHFIVRGILRANWIPNRENGFMGKCAKEEEVVPQFVRMGGSFGELLAVLGREPANIVRVFYMFVEDVGLPRRAPTVSLTSLQGECVQPSPPKKKVDGEVRL